MIKRFFPVFLSIILMSGCTSFMAMTSDGPVAEDYGKRTMGTVVEDNSIESKAKINISRSPFYSKDSNINVKSFNRVVLVTGQVASQSDKLAVANVIENIRHVRRVHNELEVAGSTTFLDRSNDTYLATKIKARLVATENVDSGRIEVTVENGSVYLMGLVTQDEATRVVNAVKKVSGIQKIVKVFEYISPQMDV